MAKPFLAMLLIAGVACALTEDLKSRVLGQVSEAHQRNLDRYMRNVTIKTVERTFDDKGEMSGEEEHKFISNADSFLLTSTVKRAVSKNLEGHVSRWLGRPDGLFRIADKAGSFIITEKTELRDQTRFEICRSEKGLSIPLATFGTSLEYYFRLPDLTVVGEGAASWNGHEATKVDAHRTIKGGIDESFYFDDKHNWVLLANEIRFPSGVTATGACEYDPKSHDPMNWSWTTRRPDGHTVVSRSVEVAKFAHENHSNDEFSLAQFGLPDEVIPARGWFGKWTWLGISAAAALLCLFFVRRAKLAR